MIFKTVSIKLGTWHCFCPMHESYRQSWCRLCRHLSNLFLFLLWLMLHWPLWNHNHISFQMLEKDSVLEHILSSVLLWCLTKWCNPMCPSLLNPYWIKAFSMSPKISTTGQKSQKMIESTPMWLIIFMKHTNMPFSIHFSVISLFRDIRTILHSTVQTDSGEHNLLTMIFTRRLHCQ